ncbi:hypothetical protein QJQ45_014435 [Haematococcus lacustris]|nr:hypothetical protein QJQ45_014435 [Haematococcus lacustris]
MWQKVNVAWGDLITGADWRRPGFIPDGVDPVLPLGALIATFLALCAKLIPKSVTSPPGPRRRAALERENAIRAKLLSSGSGSGGSLNCGGNEADDIHITEEQDEQTMPPSMLKQQQDWATASYKMWQRVNVAWGDLITGADWRRPGFIPDGVDPVLPLGALIATFLALCAKLIPKSVMSPPGPRRRAALARENAISAKLVSSGSGRGGSLKFTHAAALAKAKTPVADLVRPATRAAAPVWPATPDADLVRPATPAAALALPTTSDG